MYEYEDTIQGTKHDLNNQLADMNNKLRSLVPAGQEHVTTATTELEPMESERDETERCLTIFSHLLEQINTVHSQISSTEPPPSGETSLMVTIPQNHTMAATVSLPIVKYFQTMTTNHISFLQDLRESREANSYLEPTRPRCGMDADVERDIEWLDVSLSSILIALSGETSPL